MQTKPNITNDIDLDWLRIAASNISKQQCTLKKAASEARFHNDYNYVYTYPIYERSLWRAFNIHNIKYSAKKGSPIQEINQIKKDIILKYSLSLKCGETITFHSIRADPDNKKIYHTVWGSESI